MNNADQAAYPCNTNGFSAGLTKREQFAAMAMQGLLANPAIGDMSRELMGWEAVQHADALLKALEEK